MSKYTAVNKAKQHRALRELGLATLGRYWQCQASKKRSQRIDI